MPPCHGGDRQFKSDPGRQRGSSSVVEHNLAKVGVAGPSPVFRSIIFVLNQDRFKFRAQVAELVDAHVSGACVSQRAGSSPVLGTMFKLA